MQFQTPQSLLQSLEWRYAVKRFDPSRKIDPTLWSALEEALRLTPSSYGLQPWKFLLVESPELRTRLREASWNQTQVTDSSHFVVFAQQEEMTTAHIDRYVQLMATTRGVPIEKLEGMRRAIVGDAIDGPRASVAKEWMARQSYIALGNFMTAAAALGIDTCPMEGLDPSRYDEILSLRGTGYRTVVACAAGYRSESCPLNGAAKVRYSRAELVERR